MRRLNHKFHSFCTRYHKALHLGEHWFHCLYLGLVGIEGHGLYSKAAVGLLVVVVLSTFIRED